MTHRLKKQRGSLEQDDTGQHPYRPLGFCKNFIKWGSGLLSSRSYRTEILQLGMLITMDLLMILPSTVEELCIFTHISS